MNTSKSGRKDRTARGAGPLKDLAAELVAEQDVRLEEAERARAIGEALGTLRGEKLSLLEEFAYQNHLINPGGVGQRQDKSGGLGKADDDRLDAGSLPPIPPGPPSTGAFEEFVAIFRRFAFAHPEQTGAALEACRRIDQEGRGDGEQPDPEGPVVESAIVGGLPGFEAGPDPTPSVLVGEPISTKSEVPQQAGDGLRPATVSIWTAEETIRRLRLINTRVQIQEFLAQYVVGKTWGNLDENQRVADGLTRHLLTLGLRVACNKDGMPSRLRCYKQGHASNGAFIFEHFTENKQMKHGGTTKVPKLTVIAEGPDLRHRSSK